MTSHWNPFRGQPLTRRQVLRVSSIGFGSLALAGLLADEAKASNPG